MKQSPEYVALIETLKKEPQFMVAIAEGTRPGAEAEGLRLEAVRQKYGI